MLQQRAAAQASLTDLKWREQAAAEREASAVQREAQGLARERAGPGQALAARPVEESRAPADGGRGAHGSGARPAL